MNNEYVNLSHVNKVFKTKRGKIYALKDINMNFAEQEFVSIVGPSGCGKSTIIRLIDDIIKPTDGAITVDGYTYENNKEIPQSATQKLGFIFQIPNLYPWLTVRENLELPLKIYGLSDSKYEKRIDDLLDFVHLSDYQNAYPSEISGGMSQRIGVIRAMVHDPKILLMDEPFGALDEDTRETLNVELINIWKEMKMTVIFITHNIEEAVLLSQRVYVMSSHPGQVKTEVKIDFKDDERNLDLLLTEKFAKYCEEIEKLIGTVKLDEIK